MKVAIRADASTAIGWGHAMRCLALAQALVDTRGERATFVMADPPAAFVARAQADADVVTGEDALAQRADWVVVDGYHLATGYQRALRDAGARVLVVDDHAHLDRYHADILLNQNLGAPDYGARAPGARLLLGPRYALLRREFRTLPPRAPADGRRVLVTLGGSDPDGVTARVVAALARVESRLEVQVIAGAGTPHLDAIATAAAASPHAVALVVDARDMPARMAWAGLAVTAAGSTSWELARVGTPQIAIVLADNQRPIAGGLAEAGLAVSLGWHADLTAERIAGAVAALAADAERRAALSRRGRELVDGDGALRVLAAMGAA